MLKLPATVMALAAVTALGPLATDMYLPAMPAMAEALNTGPDRIQLTLSLYMAGFALAQLVCGPISNRFGRRPVMIAGLSLFFWLGIGIRGTGVLRGSDAGGGGAATALSFPSGVIGNDEVAGHPGMTEWKVPFPATKPRHSRAGLSGIHLDLGLQQPEPPAHRLMPVSLN